MDEVGRMQAKALARAKVRGKRLRVRAIRRGTIRGSLALFGVLWAVVFFQLVSGNDPALSTPRSQQPRVAARKPEPAAETEFEDEAEAPLPEDEFAPEAEPEEEALPFEEEPPEPEPAPIVTASS
jgi:hypothetical protein